jgi:hypothetical protein
MNVVEMFAWVPEDLATHTYRAEQRIALEIISALANQDVTLTTSPRRTWGRAPAEEAGTVYRVIIKAEIQPVKAFAPDEDFPDAIEDNFDEYMRHKE